MKYINMKGDFLKDNGIDINKLHNSLIENLSADDIKDINNAIQDLNFLDPKTITKNVVERDFDKIKEHEFMTRKLSVRLKENGWENNIVGKRGLKVVESFENFFINTIENINNKLPTKVSSKIAFYSAFLPELVGDVVKTVDAFVNLPATILVDKIPRGIGNFINYLSDASKEIKSYDRKIDTKKAGVSFTSILSKIIKDNKSNNEQDIVKNLKNFKNKYST